MNRNTLCLLGLACAFLLPILTGCNGDVAEAESTCNSSPLSFEADTATCLAFMSSGQGVQSYTLNQGKFSANANGPFPLLGGNGSRSTEGLALHPNGKLLYVAEGRGQRLSVYRVNPITGDLNSNSIDQLPVNNNDVNIDYRQMVMHPTGKFLFCTEFGNDKIEVVKIESDPSSGNFGELLGYGSRFQAYSTFDFSDYPIAMDPKGEFLYGIYRNNGSVTSDKLSAYSIDPNTSSVLSNLTQVNSIETSAFTSVATSSYGSTHLVWVTTADTLQSFKFTGNATLPTWTPFSNNSGLTNARVVVTALASFAYVGDDTGIHGFKISNPGQSLTLTAIGTMNTVPVSRLFVSPDGAYLYSGESDGIYAIDSSSGALTKISGKGFPGTNTMVMMERSF